MNFIQIMKFAFALGNGRKKPKFKHKSVARTVKSDRVYNSFNDWSLYVKCQNITPKKTKI